MDSPFLLPRWRLALLGMSLLVLGLTATPAAGQVLFAFEFSFSNPGARSMGFGGAFVALADDATAALANPAGLTQLLEPEVSIEGRSWSYSTPFTRSGRAAGSPTGIGLDTETGIARGRSEADLTGLSFLSFVYPKKKWSLALYRHQLANFEYPNETQGLFAEEAFAEIASFAGSSRLEDQRGSTDLEIVTHGVSVGWKANDQLSLGVGLAWFDGEMRISTQEYLWDANDTESFFGENSFLPERLWTGFELTTDDEAWGLVAGFLWHLSERWRLGGVFREGPKFDSRFDVVTGPAFPFFPPGLLISIPLPITFPDVCGLGGAFRSAGGHLTLSFEWDRVEYSVIVDSLEEIERRDPRITFNELIEDAEELHLGAEWAFLESSPLVAVRLGAWLDPDHRVRTRSDHPFDQAIYPLGEDEIHYAVGFGVKLERFQIDLGADFADAVDKVALSAIYKF